MAAIPRSRVPRRVSNPPNPWERTHVEWLGPAPEVRLEVFEEDARSVLSKNDSPDLPFRWSLNPYRGCYHACAYCYARPTHEYLGFGAGTDFDRKIVVKRNAPDVLRRELAKKSWRREPITLSGNTDCYQPLEAAYELTRGCIQACLEFSTPVVVITKSALVRRDADLLARLARRAGATVYLSIAFTDERTAARIEPAASPIERRFEALRVLTDAGVETGVAVSPLVPGLNDACVPEVLGRAAAAGATSAFLTLLRLPGPVEHVFRERIEQAFPERAAKIFSALSEMRDGRPNESRFGDRMRGHGPRWQLVCDLFALHCKKLGLRGAPGTAEPRRAAGAREVVRQGELFER